MKPRLLLPFFLALPLLAQTLRTQPQVPPPATPGSAVSWINEHPEFRAHPDCIFCKIVAGKASSKKVYEDDRVLVFWDIKPRAKVHLLVIPKQHVTSLAQLEELPVETRAALLSACVIAAKEAGITETGFRIIVNSGKDANQSVFHLHFHVVGGETLPEDAVKVKAAEKGKS